jgi:hypothetical protein
MSPLLPLSVRTVLRLVCLQIDPFLTPSVGPRCCRSILESPPVATPKLQHRRFLRAFTPPRIQVSPTPPPSPCRAHSPMAAHALGEDLVSRYPPASRQEPRRRRRVRARWPPRARPRATCWLRRSGRPAVDWASWDGSCGYFLSAVAVGCQPMRVAAVGRMRLDTVHWFFFSISGFCYCNRYSRN